MIEDRYGFNKQTPVLYFTDKLKKYLLAIILGGVVLGGILYFFEYAGPLAWLYAWLVIALFSILIQPLFIHVIAPMFNKFSPLEEGELNVEVDETSKYTAWKEGKLVLRRDPMLILLARIERWYNVKFNILDNRILEYTYWVTFEEENLDQVLELLSLTGPIEFEKLPKVQLEDGTFKVQEINIKLRN